MQQLGVEVHQEAADGVLVGLAQPLPERMLPLHNVVPVSGITSSAADMQLSETGSGRWYQTKGKGSAKHVVQVIFRCSVWLQSEIDTQQRYGGTQTTSARTNASVQDAYHSALAAALLWEFKRCASSFFTALACMTIARIFMLAHGLRLQSAGDVMSTTLVPSRQAVQGALCHKR